MCQSMHDYIIYNLAICYVFTNSYIMPWDVPVNYDLLPGMWLIILSYLLSISLMWSRIRFFWCHLLNILGYLFLGKLIWNSCTIYVLLFFFNNWFNLGITFPYALSLDFTILPFITPHLKHHLTIIESSNCKINIFHDNQTR